MAVCAVVINAMERGSVWAVSVNAMMEHGCVCAVVINGCFVELMFECWTELLLLLLLLNFTFFLWFFV